MFYIVVWHSDVLKDEFEECEILILYDMTCVDCEHLTLSFAIGFVLSLSLKFLTGRQTFCVCCHKWPHDVCVLLKEGMLPKMMWHNSERLPVD